MGLGLVFVDPVDENEGSPLVIQASSREGFWRQNDRPKRLKNAFKISPKNRLKNSAILAPAWPAS